MQPDRPRKPKTKRKRKIDSIQLGQDFRGKGKHTLNVLYTDWTGQSLPISQKVFKALSSKLSIEG